MESRPPFVFGKKKALASSIWFATIMHSAMKQVINKLRFKEICTKSDLCLLLSEGWPQVSSSLETEGPRKELSSHLQNQTNHQRPQKNLGRSVLLEQ
jgi:hypothetical protein